ncbi:M20 family metallopeptidase [Patescibacteria group bacterium]|nr:M20 family metallopeptidase [Patescibacteria group bacterium]
MSKKISQEIIKFTQQLVKIPSQNGIDPEKDIVKLIAKKLKSFGFSPKIIGPSKHPSVICFLKKPNAKKVIWLESCIDTVPIGDLKKWKYLPFKGVIKGNKMYGRGVADSKIAIVIFSYLARELWKNPEFKGNIFLGFDADEQSGNFTGFKQILKYAPKTDICILGYQGIKEISIGSRGWLRLKLTLFGKSAHTGIRYKKGVNAIHKMQKAIDALLNLSFLKQKEKFFEYGSSLNISLIKGGIAINVVPDKCEAIVDVRTLPSQKPKQILEEITQGLKEIKKKDKDFNFKIEVFQTQDAFLTNPDYPFLKVLKKEAQKILKREVPFVTSGGGSVGNLISEKDIPILNGFGCKCGNIHAPNEWINISDIPKVFKIYQETLIEFTKK